MLRQHLARWFSTAAWAHDDIISDVAIAALTNCTDEHFVDETRGTIEGYVYVWMRRKVEWLAMQAVAKKHRHVRIADTDNYDPEVEGIQPVVRLGAGAPQQEHVVFLKQVIERAGRLEKEEKEALQYITEQRDLWEIVHALKMPVGRLMKLAK